MKVFDHRAGRGQDVPRLASSPAPRRAVAPVAVTVPAPAPLAPVALRPLARTAPEPEEETATARPMMRVADRPTTQDDYVGQEALIARIKVVVKGAVARGQLPCHILLSGPAGFGKTTLAGIIASEIGSHIHHASGMSLRSAREVAELVQTFEPGDVFAIDEIHRLPTIVQEGLYEPLEDGMITVTSPSATHKIEVAPFVLVGMTTRPGDLSDPLRDRFGYHGVLAPYSEDELAEIVRRTWSSAGVVERGRAAVAVAERCKGVPRIAVRLARLVEDAGWASGLTTAEGTTEVDEETTRLALEHFGIWHYGLDEVDRRILAALAERYNGGPVGIANLARALDVDEGVIADEHEAALVRADMMVTSPRGRALTSHGWEIYEEMKKEGVL